MCNAVYRTARKGRYNKVKMIVLTVAEEISSMSVNSNSLLCDLDFDICMLYSSLKHITEPVGIELDELLDCETLGDVIDLVSKRYIEQKKG